MSSTSQLGLYQQVAEKNWRMEQERQQGTARKVKSGFIIFWIVDSVVLIFSVVGYLVYTPITVDPSQVFKVLAVVSGISLALGTIIYGAWLDLMKPRNRGLY